MTDDKQRLTAELLDEMKTENERAFKNAVRAKITDISNVQKQISQLALRLGELKKELKAIELVEVDFEQMLV